MSSSTGNPSTAAGSFGRTRKPQGTNSGVRQASGAGRGTAGSEGQLACSLERLSFCCRQTQLWATNCFSVTKRLIVSWLDVHFPALGTGYILRFWPVTCFPALDADCLFLLRFVIGSLPFAFVVIDRSYHRPHKRPFRRHHDNDDDDDDDDKNVTKQYGSARALYNWYISLLFPTKWQTTNDEIQRWWRTWTYDCEFSFLFLKWNAVRGRSKWFEEYEFIFWSGVFVGVAVVVAWRS